MESAVPGAGAVLLLYARGEFVRQGRNLLPGAGGRGRSALSSPLVLSRLQVCVRVFGNFGAGYSFAFPVP